MRRRQEIGVYLLQEKYDTVYQGITQDETLFDVSTPNFQRGEYERRAMRL